MKVLKRVARKCFVVCAGILVCFLLIEIILQVSGSPDFDKFSRDSESGLRLYKPHGSFLQSSSCFDNRVMINNLGFHGPDVGLSKDKNTFRIMVVGSSFVEAAQVKTNEMSSVVLQDLLNSTSRGRLKYEVIPIGFSSNGTYLDILYYERFKKMLQPDLVILLQTEYEVTHEPSSLAYEDDGSVIFENDKLKERPLVTYAKRTLRKSKLVMNIMQQTLDFKLAAKDFMQNPFPFIAKASDQSHGREPTEKQWKVEEEITRAFAKKLKEDSVPFVVASWTTPLVATSTRNNLNSLLQTLSAQGDFKYVNLNQEIERQEKETGIPSNWPCDYHWSVEGNTFAARALHGFLLKNPNLIKE